MMLLKINPREETYRIQAAVGVGVVKFLCEECDKQGGIITMEDIAGLNVLKYGITLPKHIPAKYADGLIKDTVLIVIKVLIGAMTELGIDRFNSSSMHMLTEKFTEDRLYEIVKMSDKYDEEI